MKAQFWSFDILFAIIIFVFAMVILTYVWTNISGQFSLATSGNLQHLQSQLQSLSTSIYSQGQPADWNASVDVGSPSAWQNISVGLGNGTYGSFSSNKITTLESLSSANYQDLKPALGIAYNYYITILNGGNTIGIGMNPAYMNATSVQSVTLPAVLNGNAIQVRIELWSNSSLGVE